MKLTYDLSPKYTMCQILEDLPKFITRTKTDIKAIVFKIDTEANYVFHPDRIETKCVFRYSKQANSSKCIPHSLELYDIWFIA